MAAERQIVFTFDWFEIQVTFLNLIIMCLIYLFRNRGVEPNLLLHPCHNLQEEK